MKNEKHSARWAMASTIIENWPRISDVDLQLNGTELQKNNKNNNTKKLKNI